MSGSTRTRFVVTVGASLFRALLSFATGMLLARWLGPESYGNMAFLLGTFLGVRQLLDMGSSSAFFTFLSQRSRSKRFVRMYFVWLVIQFLIPLAVVGLIFPSQWIETIWHGEQRGLVLLAFVAAFMQYSVWPAIQQAGESQRQTVWAQGLGVLVAAAHLLAVVLLWWLGMLGLGAIFAAIAVEYMLAAIALHKKYVYASTGEASLAGSMAEPLFRKYLNYCLPLIPYAWIGFAYEFADRWLLQNYGGSVEQAYYAVGAQFAGIALIATSSILRIFWKEIAEAHHQGDYARAGMLYQKVSRLLFLVGAMITGFLVPWAENLLHLMLGTAYVGGAAALAIMFLYPVHQSMGQIGGTMLYATERVSIQVVTGIVFMIASMGVTYLVLAPENAAVPGLGLASEGLALKMVVMQIIQVNVIAYIIARIWSWPFDWIYQPVSLLGCMGLGWVAAMVAGMVSSSFSLLITMGFAALIYFILVVGFIYSMPWLAGLTRKELVDDAQQVYLAAARLLK
ncbi:MAG: lipopolysaccharide biosynthesis protein [Gammaproteobacteria bacterium]|nr:lipopolysaccharide biosynthesis protein [Gammaproteobacteria bacterium]